jgi:hypothetical protein
MLILRIDVEHNDRQSRAQTAGRSFEAQRRGAEPIIEPEIRERNAVSADIRRLHGPALTAPRTAHFEKVREIRSESNIYPDLSPPLVEIPYRQRS